MHNMSKYHVVIEQDEDGIYVGRVPEIPGCLTQGDTVEELIANMKEAIAVSKEEEIAQTKFVGVHEIEV